MLAMPGSVGFVHNGTRRASLVKTEPRRALLVHSITLLAVFHNARDSVTRALAGNYLLLDARPARRTHRTRKRKPEVH